MNLTQEEDIRKYIEAWLQQKGVATEREVACGNGVRADLVTPDTVIEVKKQLNRGAIYQAYGQGVAYQTLLKKPKLMIIGLAPSSEARYQEAQRIAENVRNDKVQVIFIDKDPKWGLASAALDPGQLTDSKTAAKAALDSGAKAKSPDKSPDKPTAAKPDSPAVRLPFDVAAASTNAEAVKSAKSSDRPASSKPQVSWPTLTLHDVWALLLIILLFLWVRAYFWRFTSQPINQETPVQPAEPQPDPPPTPFTIPSVPQK